MLSSSSLEYKEALGILADSTLYVDHITDAISRQIIPRLSQTNTMIDVGAGMGILAYRLKNKFKEVTVVDVNPEVEKELKSLNFNVEICNFLDFRPERKYDFVLCSHVMYHYNSAEMKLFIDKLLSLVNPGGYCFIALIAPRGRNHVFHLQYNPNYVSSQQIISILDDEKIPYERIQAMAYPLISKDMHTMKSLLKFFLIENCQSNRSDLLPADEIDKIDRLSFSEAVKCKSGDGYAFEQEDDYMVIAYCHAIKQALILQCMNPSTLIQITILSLMGPMGVSYPHVRTHVNRCAQRIPN